MENIHQPDVLAPVLKDLGDRHKGYGTLPEYYPVMGEALLTTFAQYLKSEWTAKIQQAWVDTYEVITQLMLEGASQFTVPDKVKQSTTVKVKERLSIY